MDEYTDPSRLRFPRTGNLDAEGDWYERGRKRLARARLQAVLLAIGFIGMTVAFVFTRLQCG